MSDNRPDESWNVERLGNFCCLTQKKLAVDAWRFGHALNLARAKQDHGQWKTWKAKYVPQLTHSSEHRYRNLAKMLTEDSLQGMGLTEAYRLLDLTYTEKKAKDCGDTFPDAPTAVVAGSGESSPQLPVGAASEFDDWLDDALDDTDDLAVLPPPDAFHDLPPATGLMEVEAEPERPRMAVGLLPDELNAEEWVPVPVGQAGGPPEGHYRYYLKHAPQHMQALEVWADWLGQQSEGFRVEMWNKHGVGGVVPQIERTIEGLRWVAANLEW